MNLSELTTQQLAELIRAASAELAYRLAAPSIERIKAERQHDVLLEPPEDDKDFVLRLKSKVLGGGYVSASERDSIAELAEEFGPWIRRQGLPTERGTGPWRKLAERSRIKPARER